MFRFSLLFFGLLSVSCALKVMTLNLFDNPAESNNTKELLNAAAKITSANADIVTLQTSWFDDEGVFSTLLSFLGKEWSGGIHCTDTDITVLTKHKMLGFTGHVATGLNVRIQLNNSGLEVSVWSMYLNWEKLGPEVVHSDSPNSLLQRAETVKKLLLREKKAGQRVNNIVELLKYPGFVQQINNSDNVPVIVAGVFNSPSHLDWTEDTKANHHGLVVDWPVTKLFTNAAGMTDSFREVHPDPVAYPGNTWGVYNSTNHFENNDRIDYIFYRGSLRPTSSVTIEIPLHISPLRGNYPGVGVKSAVVTEFEVSPHKYQNKPSFFIDNEYSFGKPALINCTMKNIP